MNYVFPSEKKVSYKRQIYKYDIVLLGVKGPED